jgi:hypothetical protein
MLQAPDVQGLNILKEDFNADADAAATVRRGLESTEHGMVLRHVRSHIHSYIHQYHQQ